MSKLAIIIVIISILLACGVQVKKKGNDLSNQDKKIEIRYSVTDAGITRVVIPYELNSNLINGVEITNITYKGGIEGGVYTIIKTDKSIKLDLNSCPVINGYIFKAKCEYRISN